MNESQQTAIAHLSMLAEYARGNLRHKPEDIEKRFNSVLSFLVTGRCVAEETDRPVVDRVRETLAAMVSEGREAVHT